MKNKNIPQNWNKKFEKDLHKLTLIGLKRSGMKYRKEIMGYNFNLAVKGMELK